jgi:tetratricopeptide (TPR) repeat protein
MMDLVATFLLGLEREVALLPGATLIPARNGAKLVDRLAEACGRSVPAGVAGFFSRYNGGALSPDTRILSFEDALAIKRDPRRTNELKGLWPVVERHGRLSALDPDYPGVEGEWPVVELADRSVDRAGSTLLRYLEALAADLRLGADADELDRARELCRCDPGLADHWVDLVEVLERSGKREELEEALQAGLRSASPPGPALVLSAGILAADRGDRDGLLTALEDALAIEPLTARDDDARLDAAAITLVLALEQKDAAREARAREMLGTAAVSTGTYWRGEAVRALTAERDRRAALSLSIVEGLVPGDTDAARLRERSPALMSALHLLVRARDALDHGAADEAVRAARSAVSEAPELGMAHAVLAEALNARRERGAAEAARRATELNPALTDAWRELGDACLDVRQAAKAEQAYRELVARDPSNGLGLAKLAQALLEQGRTREALEAIDQAAERGGDVFFVNAVRGDILGEMSRHEEAAEAYDLALILEPEDHWALHQAALEHSRAGHGERAMELFERALAFDREGCHQTLVDYADLMRRMGRIGDAVRLYRRAVAAVPNDPEWRQVLREAERELQAAPN